MSRLAVIDIGTNTFHLLIVEVDTDGMFTEIARKRVYVKLAEDGIRKIGEQPFKRGQDALKLFRSILDLYQITNLKAIGTAALRTAENGKEFLRQALVESQIPIGLIPGEEEARLIYVGTKRSIPPGFAFQKCLIMDIGGGSVEFILADQNKILWSASFPVGVSVLYNNYHKSDPISKSEITSLKNFLSDQLAPLQQQLALHDVPLLVGSSGAFEVVESFLMSDQLNDYFSTIPANRFQDLFTNLRFKTLEERYDMEQMPRTRAEMIVVAFILIEQILEWGQFQDIAISAFAMKEGILTEMVG